MLRLERPAGQRRRARASADTWMMGRAVNVAGVAIDESFAHESAREESGQALADATVEDRRRKATPTDGSLRAVPSAFGNVGSHWARAARTTRTPREQKTPCSKSRTGNFLVAISSTSTNCCTSISRTTMLDARNGDATSRSSPIISTACRTSGSVQTRGRSGTVPPGRSLRSLHAFPASIPKRSRPGTIACCIVS